MFVSDCVQITVPTCITQKLFYCVASLFHTDGCFLKPQLKLSKNDTEEKYVVLPS